MNTSTENPKLTEPGPGPTISGVFGHGWVILKKHFPELLLVLMVEVLVSLPVGFTNSVFFPLLEDEMYTGLFNVLYGLFVLAPVSYGCSWIFLKAVREEAFHVTDMFFAFQQIGQVLLANILAGLIIGLGLVMLVVPGIIFACKLVFVPYLVMDKKLNAMDAIRASWEMTKGHSWTVFWMAIVGFFILLLGIICFIVGIIPAILWISLAFATLYLVVSAQAKPNLVL